MELIQKIKNIINKLKKVEGEKLSLKKAKIVSEAHHELAKLSLKKVRVKNAKVSTKVKKGKTTRRRKTKGDRKRVVGNASSVRYKKVFKKSR